MVDRVEHLLLDRPKLGGDLGAGDDGSHHVWAAPIQEIPNRGIDGANVAWMATGNWSQMAVSSVRASADGSSASTTGSGSPSW